MREGRGGTEEVSGGSGEAMCFPAVIPPVSGIDATAQTAGTLPTKTKAEKGST